MLPKNELRQRIIELNILTPSWLDKKKTGISQIDIQYKLLEIAKDSNNIFGNKGLNIYLLLKPSLEVLKQYEIAFNAERNLRPKLSFKNDKAEGDGNILLEDIHNNAFQCLLEESDDLLLTKDKRMFSSLLSVTKVAYSHFRNESEVGKDLSKKKIKANDAIKNKLLSNCFDVFSKEEYINCFKGIMPLEYFEEIKGKNKEKLKNLFIDSFFSMFPEHTGLNLAYNIASSNFQNETIKCLREPDFRNKIKDSIAEKTLFKEKLDFDHYVNIAYDLTRSLDGFLLAIPYPQKEHNALKLITKNIGGH